MTNINYQMKMIWLRVDSNHQPRAYETLALCRLSYTAAELILEARGGVEPRAFPPSSLKVRFRRPTPGTRAIFGVRRPVRTACGSGRALIQSPNGPPATAGGSNPRSRFELECGSLNPRPPMNYFEVNPSPALAGLIKCYWVIEDESPA